MKKLLSFAALLALLSGCAQADGINENLPVAVDAPETLYAEFDTESGDKEDETRTYVVEERKLRWHEGDEISFFPVTYNMCYRFNGATGSNGGSFSKVTTDLVTGNSLPTRYAVYPYQGDTKINEFGNITYYFPDWQSYGEKSFGRGANVMVAATENHDDNVLRFRNVGGYLKLQVYSSEQRWIDYIELEGNNGERITGEARIETGYGWDPWVEMTENAGTRLSLNCYSYDSWQNVRLSTDPENPTDFWFVLPPTYFENGVTVRIHDTEGNVCTKSTYNWIPVDRNYIQPLSTFEFVVDGGDQGGEDETSLKVYVDVSATGWNECYLWAWNLEEGYSYTGDAWPGEYLIDTETINGTTYYVWNAPAELLNQTIGVIPNILTEQTVDLHATLTEDGTFIVLTEVDESGKWLATVSNGTPGGNVTGGFSFENISADIFSFTLDIIPEDKEAPYIIMSANPEYINFGGLETGEDFYNDDMEYFNWLGGFYGKDAVGIMQDRSRFGDQRGVTIGECVPGVPYVFYCYYFDWETGALISDVTMIEITTTEPEKSQIALDVQYNVEGSLLTVDVLAQNYDGAYYFDIIPINVIDSLLQDYKFLNNSPVEAVEYFWADAVQEMHNNQSLSYEEIVSTYNCQGYNDDGTLRSHYEFEMEDNNEYYIIAFAMEEHGLACSVPQIVKVNLNGEDSDTRSIEITEVTYNSITFTINIQDSYVFQCIDKAFLEYNGQTPEEYITTGVGIPAQGVQTIEWIDGNKYGYYDMHVREDSDYYVIAAITNGGDITGEIIVAETHTPKIPETEAGATVELKDITSTSVTVATTPDDNVAEYYVWVESKEKIEYYVSVGDSESILNSLIKNVNSGSWHLTEANEQTWEGLTPDTDYYCLTLTIDNDGAQSLSKLEFRTLGASEGENDPTYDLDMTFDISVEDITATHAAIKITPSSNTDTFNWMVGEWDGVQTAEEVMNDIVNSYAEYFNNGWMLYSGVQDYTGGPGSEYKFKLSAPDTDYYVIAFGYSGGVTTAPHMVTFRSLPGADINEVEFTMEASDVQPYTAMISISPSSDTVYYSWGVVRAEDWDETSTIESSNSFIDEMYRNCLDINPNITMGEILNMYSLRGNKQLRATNLYPETTYMGYILMHDTTTGHVVRVITIPDVVTTHALGSVTPTLEVFGIFSGDEEAGQIFGQPDVTAGKAIVAIKINNVEGASSYYYGTKSGDHRDYDYGRIYSEVSFNQTNSEYMFFLSEWDSGMTYWAAAKDGNGIFGSVANTYVQCDASNTDDIDLLFHIGGNSSNQQ